MVALMMMMMVVLSLIHLLVEGIKNKDHKAEDSISCHTPGEPPSTIASVHRKQEEKEPRKAQILKPSQVYTLEVTIFFFLKLLLLKDSFIY